MNRGVKLYVYALCLLLGAVAVWVGKERLGLHKKITDSTRAVPVVPVTPAPLPITPPVVIPPRVAIVIDDVAYNTTQMDHFVALGIPLTFAILPRHKLSPILSKKARDLDMGVMLHMPMEPHDVINNSPGPSALYLTMTEPELKSQFDKAVASVPDLKGINNHMGSAFTEDEEKMKLVMGWAKARGLFFLDSYTTQKSAVLRAGRKAQVPTLRNETFLDNEDSLEGIEKQLDHVMKMALKRKKTIAIGHYRRKYIIEALVKKIPEFREKGIEFVTVDVFYPS